MKSLIKTLLIVVSTLLVFTGCNEECENKVAALTTQVNALTADTASLQKTIRETPTKEAIIADYEAQLALQQKSQKVHEFGFDTLKMSSIPMFANSTPNFELSALTDITKEYDFQFVSDNLAELFGTDVQSLKAQLEMPSVLKKFFEDNKKFAATMLRITGYLSFAQNDAGAMLPYVNNTAPANRIAAFKKFFEKHGTDDYIHSFEYWESFKKDKTDWNILKTESEMVDDARLMRHYKIWLFVERRKAAGGDELMKVIEEILIFIKDIKPLF